MAERGRGPDRFRRPDAEEQDQARHRADRGDDVDELGPDVVGHQVLRDREAQTRDEDRRPDLHHYLADSERPDQPERHEQGEQRQDAADHSGERHQVVAVHLGHRDDRRAERAVRDRRRVGDQREPRRGERREAEADQDRRRHGDRRAEPGRSLEERAVGERDQEQLQAPVLRDVGDRVFLDLAGAALVGKLVQEDDVEDDPADRQQTGEAAEHRRLACHLDRHSVGKDGHHQRREQAEPGRDVRFQVQEAEADQHDDHRQRCQQRRDDHVAERVVALLPDHAVLLSLTLVPAPGAASGITVSVRMPCAPRISTPSMSAVADGPVISTA